MLSSALCLFLLLALMQLGDVTPEISLMQMLEHPNIVKFLGTEVNEQEGVVYIFMERVSGGSIKGVDFIDPLYLMQLFDFSHHVLVAMMDSYGPLPESVMILYTR